MMTDLFIQVPRLNFALEKVAEEFSLEILVNFQYNSVVKLNMLPTTYLGSILNSAKHSSYAQVNDLMKI